MSISDTGEGAYADAGEDATVDTMGHTMGHTNDHASDRTRGDGDDGNGAQPVVATSDVARPGQADTCKGIRQSYRQHIRTASRTL